MTDETTTLIPAPKAAVTVVDADPNARLTVNVVMNSSLGSLWRKWDLHVHTPASFRWTGERFSQMPTERRDACLADLVEAINDSDVAVFGIMDYWTFDGYLAVRDHLNQNPALRQKTILPGIELRMEAPTNHRLNTHVLFDDLLSSDTLAQFMANLRIGGPQGKPPSKEHFIALAKSYDDGKLRIHGHKPEDRNDVEKMQVLGMMTAVVTRESLQAALELVGDQHYLVIQPYDTNDGLEELDWQRHPYTDSFLMKWSDIFETRNPVHVSLFLGLGHPTRPHVGAEFLHNLGGYPKPAVSGSDAHRVADYGNYPSGRGECYS